MNIRPIITTLLLLVVGLAGCSSDPSDADPIETTTGTSTTTSTTTTSSTGTSTTTTTTSAPAQQNKSPTASLSASIEAGEAPVAVEFTLEGADADGDALTWMFDADEDGTIDAEGTDLPATVSFNYTTEGVYNATLTVSDGVNQTQAVRAIDVTAAVAQQEGLILTGGVLFADPWAVALGGCLADAGRRDAGGPNGITGTEHAIAPEQWGWTYAFDVTGVIAEFWSPDAILGAAAAGTVPEGADSVVVCIDDPTVADVSYALSLQP